MNLEKKVAVITGAGSGIGREIALEFARKKAAVVCAGRRKENLDHTVELIESENGNAFSLATDVSSKEQVENLIDEVINRFNKIDILFNNAGSFQCLGPVWEVDPSEWWKDVETNLLGTMLCCRAVLPHMLKRNEGIIINMDGGGGTPGPNIGGSGYGCSKAAIVRFTEALGGELARIKSNILVFALNPGTVMSAMVKNLLSQKDKLLWTIHLQQEIERGDVVSEDACAKATMELLDIACHELSGRTFHQDSDFVKLKIEKQRIMDDNLYVFKWVTLPDENRSNK